MVNTEWLLLEEKLVLLVLNTFLDLKQLAEEKFSVVSLA